MVKFHDEQSTAPSVMGDPAIVTSRPLPTSNSNNNNITTTSAPLQTQSTPTTTTTQTMPVPSSNSNPGTGTSQNHSNSNQQPGTNGTHSRNNGNIAAAASSSGGGAMMQVSGYNNQNRVVDNYVGPLNHRPHNKTRHHHHHLHHAPMQHYHHFHHHWSYPDPTAVVPPPHHGQATFHFGPGFEPQQPLHAPRFPPAHNNAHGGGPSAGSSTGNSEHVVHFHVNPGVTVSFQIGDNMELIRVPSPYGEYYPDGGHYYLPAPHPHQHPHPQELCPHQHHQQLCALHGDYGPVTVPMVSTNSSPPIAMPVQVPPGHVVQQIVDESGTLRHVILSHQPPIVPMPPPPHSHNPQHYGPGPANGTNQPPQPFFPQGLAPPYGGPPAHFGGMPPGHLAPPPPPSGQPGHSPPPSGPTSQHNYLHSKDERTQRQYNKLRRKLEQKHAYTYGSGQSTPALSPRKELVNGLRRSATATVAKESRGMSSVGTSEDGEESSSVQDEEDDVHAITDILSSVQSPQVSDISSRSALLKWSVPRRLSEASSNSSHDYDISETDLRYEVLLSDKGKEGKYKAIYSGSSLSCRIQDLRPGQEYSVCLQVHYDELQGNASEPLIFLTPPCEPDQPQPPKLISRSRTSLQLRWNSATDNGSHISHYILECDDGKGEDHFVELSRGRGKQHNLQKLQPTTCYKFRLAAVNECGKSAYSEIASFSTSGSPPGQPLAPLLKEARISSLHLTWLKRPNDDDFTLQMDDRQNKHGFLPIFTGKETEYVCRGLRRATEFKFRLRAHNEEGASRWSDEVSYRTLPDRPAQPLRPNVKGKIHAHQFKLKWDPPNDKGGAEICNYVLELNSGSGYEIVYKGPETEAVCDRLTPGTTYQLRVYCISAGGQSDCSEPCTVTTDAICPNRCAPPKLVTKPRSNSISLRWLPPDYNGGAPVIEYELEITYPDSSKRIVYKGKDTECTVNELLPGQVYVFVVRALNRVGVSPWSDAISVTSGAAAPNTPEPPDVIAKSPFHIQVEWKEPPCNGSPIIEYKVEISCSNEEENFNTIFQGLSMHHDIKGLMPFTPYYFRLQACNDAGRSPFSPVSMAVTPAAVPAACAAVAYESTPTSISLSWHEPVNNGSDILYYNIEIGDKSITTEGPVLEYEIERLNPDSVYKIKIQAVNSVGPGPFSPVLKATTLPLPPSPPKLECIGIGHNYLKLKWGEGKNIDFTRYCVEIDNPRVKEFQCVYQGTSFTCKVNKLQELTTYRFRISAANDYAGQGDWSEVYEFKTCIAPPAGMKAPKASEITQRTCVLEWNPCKVTGGDPVTYQVQLTRVKDQDFKQVHEGSETKCTLSELDSGAEYSARVCPIRQASTGPLPGAYSPVCNFSTQAPDPVSNQRVTTPSVNNSPVRSRQNQKLFAWLSGIHSSNNKQMSDQQKAIIILIVFTVFAIFAAVLVEQFIIWRQSV